MSFIYFAILIINKWIVATGLLGPLPNSALQKLSTMLSRVPGCLQGGHVFSSGNTTKSNDYLHTNTLHYSMQLVFERFCCHKLLMCAWHNRRAKGRRFRTRVPSKSTIWMVNMKAVVLYRVKWHFVLSWMHRSILDIWYFVCKHTLAVAVNNH